MDFPSGLDPRQEAAAASIKQLRSRLLDLTGRNPLVSFPHGRAIGGRVHLRAVDGHMDSLFAQLAEGKPLTIGPLPPAENEPADEKDPGFQATLEAARLTDEHYIEEAAKLSIEELASAKAASVERRLRDSVRDSLGMSPWEARTPRGLADHAASMGIDPSFDLRPTPPTPKRIGVEFQALALPDTLERQLATIRDTARTVAEETGVSTLHMAFGFLEWFESDASDRAITSPLILMRVDIDRRIVRSRYQYSVSAIGDEAEANLTLSERLDRDFRIQLPDLQDEESPESYLERVREEVCESRPRWTVRRFVTLAHFPFARLAMFHDLDEAQWPEGLSSNTVVAALLGGREAGPTMFAEEHDIDAPAVSAKAPVLVLDADASQHSAVYDVMNGQDLVIEGPPGTGKSQTITNIIGAALADGQRVLFVADKQAALQVVKDRLDKAGLGDFCLELHSGKARKTEILASLQQRLARRPTPSRPERLDAKLRELAATRIALTRYVETLNAPFGALGLTVHELLWADRRRREGEGVEARRLDEVALPSCETLARSDVEARRAVLDRFERAAMPLARFGTPAAHPWRGVTRAGLPSADMEQAVRDAADTGASFAAAAAAGAALLAFGAAEDAPLDELGLIAPLASLQVPEGLRADWFAAFAIPDVRAAAAEWLQACRQYRHALAAQQAFLALPDEHDPGTASNELAASWRQVAASAAAGMTVNDFPAWAGDLRGKSGLLSELERVAAETAAAFGIMATENLGEVSVAMAAASLAAEAPQAVADFVVPELMRGGNAETVASAAAAIHAARARRAELEAEYSIPPAMTPGLLRQHAATLAAAGLLGFMSPAVKAAQLCFAGLLRTPRKAAKATMVAAMVGIAEHLEAAGAIEAGDAFRAAFGSRYRGLSTDVDTALAAVAWAARVRSALPQAAGPGALAAAALLSGDAGRLRSIRALAARPEQGTLQAALARFPAAAPSFSDLARRLDEQAQSVDRLALRCRELGVPAAARADSLPAICAALRTTADAMAAIHPPAALQGTCPAPLDDHGPFEAALQLASAVERLAVPPSVRDALWLTPPETLRTEAVPAAAALAAALENAAKRWAPLVARLGLDESGFLGRPLGNATPAQAEARLAAATSHPGELGGWISYLKEREAAEAFGLGPLLALWDEQALPLPLAAAFDRVLHRGLARAAFQCHPELERFTGLGQQEARTRFAALDAEAAALRKGCLADTLSNRPVPSGIEVGKPSERTERSLILHEIGKQKRHISIRQLLGRAGDAVQALKPCFMMSPLSVARYLKPGQLGFDLLVIDEASQMRPEDAIGAVARCRQIVVVGDPKQLPPTSFFARSDGPNDDGADEEIDAESILDLAQAVFRPMRRLRWHYRSRHGSLIAFSNREFYDGDLMVFPSPAEADDGQGVRSVKVDGIYQARANLAEVAAVCAAAVEHMRTRPGRSLGIATMNQVQRELIALEMDRLATLHPEVEAYRERWNGTLERFFVKNLENVQGDERDFIFISTVFGPATPGGRVRQVFGPINGASGHRRLNVLFTRAKHHVRLFTSMAPDDITAGPDSPRGAQVLKAYLAYAQTGRLDAGVATQREADSDFEVFVRDRLRLAGYDAAPQVGVAGYFIDLAVRDPASPATFLLGIECDGASYHSSRSARDRDILRQQILEGLGWTIYRIWSTDWFRDPEGQTRKLVSFIEDMKPKG
jgi:very-short-patch-repair endonuclease